MAAVDYCASSSERTELSMNWIAKAETEFQGSLTRYKYEKSTSNVRSRLPNSRTERVNGVCVFRSSKTGIIGTGTRTRRYLGDEKPGKKEREELRDIYL